ncbi:extracellular solute-binding protein [Anaeromicropila herbilytica]|uniref:ABC transporter substrate-binding protein n=1 Tax=Anaeromicropila herbilytica TaxID=2785025 RepID=A0A7R7IBG4_9FIRM|nr:extracellular solute-binding protein [Anaeromicropila herbilytica]BCN29628.1 ABC transporter substrate-binding protein [Anaeromicropila herbilytica]
MLRCLQRGRNKIFIAVFIFLLSGLLMNHSVLKAKTDTSLDQYKEDLDSYSDSIGYNEYIKQYDNNIRPTSEYVINAKDFVRVEGMNVSYYNDYKGVSGTSVLTDEKGLIEYEVNVQEEGLYDMSLLYYPIEGKSAAIQRGIFIDGKLPYKEFSTLEFQRIWVNQTKTWEVDNQGNDLKPKQIEAPDWMSSYLYDSQGYVTDALPVYLTKGVHTITLVSQREPMLLRSISLKNEKEIQKYKEVKKEYKDNGYKNSSKKMIKINAEDADRKSSQMLYPVQDKSSPSVTPYDSKELKNNTIGGNNWRLVGQWIEWDFNVKESGLYNISLHDKQNFVKGIYTSRKITIDGKVPFQELSDYGFKYTGNWRMEKLADKNGKAYKFYLEKGKHTIRMEVVLGDFSTIVSDVQDIMMNLNSIYRKVIRITGVAPDEFRDYQIATSIPGLADELKVQRDRLNDVISRLKAAAGAGSDKETVLITMRDQLDTLIKDVEKFTKLVGSYKINTTALGTWITQVIAQPLQLDTIYIYSPNYKAPKVHDSFWDKLTHEAKALFNSFIIDYNKVGNVTKSDKETKSITLWVGTGRDQANTIKGLIDETFTKETGIGVNVMLVDMSTLLQATLAGQGPDVAIQVGNDLPMNYGLRNAVADLSQFSDLAEVRKRFYDSAMVPFEFDGKTYALPETQTFPMMFYRKDILKELNLKVPQTWDDMKVAMSVLSKNQMELGMLPTNLSPQLAEQVFAMLLYQNGGEYYNKDATKSALDSDAAINAFKEYTEFYTDYKLDRETSVENRFRTGECPIIIADYTVYNTLQVSAPDIKGLWGFTTVPGTVKEDGSVDHTVSSTGLGCVMMDSAKDKESSWEFMKWWTSADTQTLYGRELEGLMGAAARYPTANIEAFSELPWPTDDFEALKEQFKTVKGIPQVPGGYYSWRNVNNAFYKVVVENSMAPREALMEYVRYINDEINNKRDEFGLPLADN